MLVWVRKQKPKYVKNGWVSRPCNIPNHTSEVNHLSPTASFWFWAVMAGGGGHQLSIKWGLLLFSDLSSWFSDWCLVIQSQALTSSLRPGKLGFHLVSWALVLAPCPTFLSSLSHEHHALWLHIHWLTMTFKPPWLAWWFPSLDIVCHSQKPFTSI